MRVAIDIRRITEFGVGTYTRNAIRTLTRLDHDNQYFLIGDPNKLGPRGQLGDLGQLPPNFTIVPGQPNELSLGSYLELHRILKDHRCDLLHVPHLFWKPQGIPCPYVVTVHDLLDHMYRVNSHSAVKRNLHFQFTRRVLHHAARIFAVSNFSKADTVRIFQVPAEKIEVIYNAIDDRLRMGHASEAERRFIAERYQVNSPFLLYAGRISPHKNVVRIIEAFAALKSELSKEGRFEDLKLIIIGDEVSKHPDLRRACVKADVQNEVRFLGFVPIDVLRIFYDQAKIFVFPSLYEGFGLPPLEAMAQATPVVTSNTSSIPEVVGNAAVMVNPENVFEIMRALHRVLLDQPLRDKLKARGVEQAAKFSWDASVRRMLEIYRTVAQ
ncbi:MAG TPA: glycosyltransferase family 1 protein [Candidatus Bathyarchaeia archaeon]|nr:glycosyltransferase family 1 protein [Candidatus Bathyarchaeia archaeon]